jgi:hypothetical protein
MTKLGDRLRELAAAADRGALTGIAFVQVDDWSRQVTSAGRSADPERDAKALVTSLYQVARVYTMKREAPSQAVISQRVREMNMTYYRDRLRPHFAEMCAAKKWSIPITELRATSDAILIGGTALATREEIHAGLVDSEIYARMEKICAERVEQPA